MIPEAQKQQMAEAVAHIRETMAAAARAAGRDPAQIKLCAACKTRTVEEVRCSAERRSTSLARTMCRSWSRKPMPVPTTASRGILSAMDQQGQQGRGPRSPDQSVDSTRLLDKIDTAAARLGLVQDILVEINIGEKRARAAWTPTACSPCWRPLPLNRICGCAG